MPLSLKNTSVPILHPKVISSFKAMQNPSSSSTSTRATFPSLSALNTLPKEKMLACQGFFLAPKTPCVMIITSFVELFLQLSIQRLKSCCPWSFARHSMTIISLVPLGFHVLQNSVNLLSTLGAHSIERKSFALPRLRVSLTHSTWYTNESPLSSRNRDLDEACIMVTPLAPKTTLKS